MRVKSSALNIFSNVSILIIQTILLLVVRIIFINNLGIEYLGLQNLLVNIMSMLSLTELGIAYAISFSLYKPLADKDHLQVSKIISLYKKIYFGIGIGISVFGIMMLPFLDYLIVDYTVEHLEIIFLIYLITLVSGYFISYKEILISADQKGYKLLFFNLFRIILTYSIQIVVLLLTKSFIYFILVELIIYLIRRFAVNSYIKNYYKEIDFKCKEKLKKDELKKITKNVKYLFCNKIGIFLLDGTDNIIISSIIGLASVGIYANYLSIVSILKNLLNSFINGITSSFGNLVTENNRDSQYVVFKIMNLITFAFVGMCSVGMFNIFNPFIKFLFGEEYIFSQVIVIVIVFNFFLSSVTIPLESVKNANGYYKKNRYLSLIQAIINLFISILFGIKFGIIGVFLGTTISYILTTSWKLPYNIYKYIFNVNPFMYYINFVKEMSLILISIVLSNLIYLLFDISSLLLNIIIGGILSVVTYAAIFILFHFKTLEFKEAINNFFKLRRILNEKDSIN